MSKEIKYIIINLFKTISKKETLYLHLLPLVVDGLLVIIYYFGGNTCNVNLSGLNDILSDYITIFTLFVSFTIGYLTMLITSSGGSINSLKTNMSKHFFIDRQKKEPFSLFQILMTHITYTVFIEIIALICCVLGKFTYILNENIVFQIVFWGITMLFIYTALLLIQIIKNVYLSFWKNKESSGNI